MTGEVLSLTILLVTSIFRYIFACYFINGLFSASICGVSCHDCTGRAGGNGYSCGSIHRGHVCGNCDAIQCFSIDVCGQL